MSSDYKAVRYLFFCYMLFSFAVCENGKRLNVYNWLFTIGLCSAIYVLYIILTVDGKKIKPLAGLYLLLYIIYLIAVQTDKMYKYMKIYHGQTSAVSTAAVTIAAFIVFVLYDNTDITRLYLPLSAMIILLLLVVTVLNFDKVSRCNLALNSNEIKLTGNITLFDYIVPFIIISNTCKSVNRKKAIGFILKSWRIISVITIFCFMCLSGNLLYSISPLQAVFQITSTNLIRNYDALFNYLLYFSYFAALILLFTAYKRIKSDFEYTGKWDLLLTIPFLMTGLAESYYISVIAEIIGVLAIFFGKEDFKYNEKT